MKNLRTQWWIWLLVIAVLTGCEQDSEQVQPVNSKRVLTARIESGAARTVVDEDGNVCWTETDAIGVFGTQNTHAKFQSTGSGASVSFVGTLADDEEAVCAYYPYDADAKLQSKTLTMMLPSEYIYTGENQAPMLGVKTDEDSFVFKHLGGLLRFQVIGLTDDIGSIILTSKGENAPGLAGKAIVDDISVDEAVLRLEDDASNSVTVNFGEDKSERKSFCIFIPVGTYPKLEVVFKNKSGDEIVSKTLSNVTMTRAKLLDMPTINVAEGVSPSYVPVYIDEENETLPTVSATNEVVLELGENTPVFEEGKSVIIVSNENKGVNEIRIVESVVEDGDKVTLKTREGDMTDIFMGKEFTLSTNPYADVSRTGMGEVIRPYKIVASNVDGSRSVLYDAKDEELSRAFISKDIDFFEKEIDHSGKTILKEGGAHLFWEKCRFAASLDAVFQFNFGEVIEVVDGIEIPKGELNGFFYVLEGDVEADMKLKLTAEQEYSLGTEEPIPVLTDVLGPNGITLYFMVGGVGVPVTLNADFYVEASMKAKAEMEMSAGMCAGLNVKMGASYHKDTDPKPEGMIAPRFSFYKPELSVKGTVESDATFYPVYHIGFFQFADVNVSTEPHVCATFEFGGKVGGEEDELYGGWNSRLYTESYIKTDFTLGFAGMTTWSSPVLQFPKNPEETDLHISPKYLDLVSPKEDESFRLGKTIPVKFGAKDYSVLSDLAYSLGAVVKFTATDGELSKQFEFTNINGEATVDWTPKSKEDVLTAEILGANGEAIATANYTPNMKEPFVVTSVQSDGITTREATLYGKLTGMEDAYEYKYGICYSMEENPTIETGTVIEGKDMEDGSFKVSVTGLEPKTTYYWRAYATEDGEITLGDVKTFDTLTPKEILSTTGETAGVGGTYAVLTGTLDGVDDQEDYEYGFYYSMTENPQSGAKVISDGIDNGAYSTRVEGLEAGKTYYWQAYANVDETYYYGEVKSFSTPSPNGDRDVLVALYQNNGGENWRNQANWCTDAPLDDWAGVTTDEDGFVISLSIPYSYGKYVTGDVNLSGLTRLEGLYVERHRITSLDVSGCSNLKELVCWGNESLSSIDLEGCNGLEFINVQSCDLLSLDVSNRTNLTRLLCDGNQMLTSLNIVGCKNLQEVNISDCKIANALDFSNNVSLTGLSCDGNELPSLNVKGCISLDELMCGSNHLTTLDVSDCTQLTYLFCGGNQLSSLDVSANTKLQNLACGTNQLTSLDVSNCKELVGLSCNDNLLTELNVSTNTLITSLGCSNNQITSLDVRNLSELQTLYCYKNKLTDLQVSGLTKLYYINCENNLLAELKFTDCTGMQYVECNDNKLTTIDVSQCPELLWLYCHNNVLTSLDVTANTLLERLDCSHNSISSLNLTNNKNVIDLRVGYNLLETIDVSNMLGLEYFSTYANESLKQIYISTSFVFDNSSNDHYLWGNQSYDYTEDAHLGYYQYPEFIRK